MKITHRKRQYHQRPKAEIREESPSVIQHYPIWSKCLNSHPRIILVRGWKDGKEVRLQIRVTKILLSRGCCQGRQVTDRI